MTPKSNKPRGSVKLDRTGGSPVISRTANPQRAEINQPRGPSTGNRGTPAKQRAMLAEKNNRTSYFQQLADMVSRALTRRGEGHKPHTLAELEPVSAITRVRRGPTRGNK